MLQWIEDHEALAAWVQAIGAIVAIIGAFLIAYFEGRRAKVREEARGVREEADRLRRAQGLALMLQPELRAFEGRVEQHILHAIDRSPTPPKSILDHADQLHLLGEAGGAILQMIGVLNADAWMVRRSIPEEELAQFDKLRAERLQIARACCAEAVRGLERIIQAGGKS
jgi:hypothetical protein